MKEFYSMTLWEASFNKLLFRKELESLISSTSTNGMSDLLKYCYDKYSDTHADVLLEVFSTSKANYKKEPVTLGKIN